MDRAFEGMHLHDVLPKPEPTVPVAMNRNPDETLAILHDCYRDGRTWEQAAEAVGRTPSQLRSWSYTHRKNRQVATWWPEKFPRVVIRERFDDIVADLTEMAECGEEWPVAARRVGFERPQSLAARLVRTGHRRVLAKFGRGVWVA